MLTQGVLVTLEHFLALSRITVQMTRIGVQVPESEFSGF